MKNIFYLILFSFFYFGGFGQAIPPGETSKSLSIDQQFEDLYRKSGNYQEYEVAKKVWLLDLQKNIADSLQGLKTELLRLQSEVTRQQNTITDLQNQNSQLQSALTDLQQAQNSIGWLGFIDMHKNYYRLLMWGLLILVSVLFAVFYFKFKAANVHTKNAQNALKELEEEYENHRQRAMEREQKAMRRLQDEINKNKYATSSKK